MPLSKLIDALKKKYKTPQEAVKALGLDERLLEAPAADSKPKEKPVFNWGFDRFQPKRKAFDFSRFAKDAPNQALVAKLKREIAGLEWSLDPKNPNVLRGSNARRAAASDLYEARNELKRALGAKDEVQIPTLPRKVAAQMVLAGKLQAPNGTIKIGQNEFRLPDGKRVTYMVTGDDVNTAPASELTIHEKRGEKSAKTPGGHLTFKPASDASFESGLKDDEPRIVSGVKGMKSTPFRKRFPNAKAMERWMDSSEASDYEIQYVERA